MKKRHILGLAGIVAGALTCTGCHKTCTCTSYDGARHDYTADEVDAEGVTCSAMADAVNQRFHTVLYSYCEWN